MIRPVFSTVTLSFSHLCAHTPLLCTHTLAVHTQAQVSFLRSNVFMALQHLLGLFKVTNVFIFTSKCFSGQYC